MRVSASPQFQQILAVGVPIVALVISLAVVYPAWGRYGEIREQVDKQQKELATLKATPLPPRDPVLPAVNDSPAESALFLGQIVALTLAPQCRFVGLDTAPGAGAKAGSAIRPVRTKVEVEGQYPQIRQFLAQVAGAPRLFVVTSLDVASRPSSQPGQLPGGLHATVELERYLVPATGAAKSATTASR